LLADAIPVPANLLDDIGVIEDVRFVMKGGGSTATTAPQPEAAVFLR